LAKIYLKSTFTSFLTAVLYLLLLLGGLRTR